MELVVEDLSCARGGLPVIEHLDFRVAPGSALILRGPNGSGKTTLLRTLAGLQPPHGGRVSPSPEAFAYAGHADAVKATLTVTENLGFWASVHGSDRVASALAAFDLEALANRMAQHLSAGQRRRLGLARLAVSDRPVWALDEPTVSLDSASVARFCDVIRAHLATGGIAVVATHLDLGIEAEVLDMTRFAAQAPVDDFDAAFA
jgi:heme exporter protein A